MAKQNPDLMLLKIKNTTGEEFSTLCGLNSRNLSLDGENVDVTTIDCSGEGGKLWREHMAGVSQVSFSGNGFFQDKAQSTRLVNSKLTGTSKEEFEVIVPGLGTFTGTFIIGTLGIAGEISGGGVTQSLELASSGAIVFAAEA